MAKNASRTHLHRGTAARDQETANPINNTAGMIVPPAPVSGETPAPPAAPPPTAMTAANQVTGSRLRRRTPGCWPVRDPPDKRSEPARFPLIPGQATTKLANSNHMTRKATPSPKASRVQMGCRRCGDRRHPSRPTTLLSVREQEDHPATSGPRPNVANCGDSLALARKEEKVNAAGAHPRRTPSASRNRRRPTPCRR